ncbi:hypothetical protein QBC45DRAFT_330882 [Copromyces sp. CBS 386.78]|nr:hypothetical protein QBC45DRAFT_330882 [Copromyces sp. CBS 386.78]
MLAQLNALRGKAQGQPTDPALINQQQPLPDAHNDARSLPGMPSSMAVDHTRCTYLFNTAKSNRRMSVARPPVQTLKYYGRLRCDGNRFS